MALFFCSLKINKDKKDMTKFINAKCDFCGKEYVANKKSYQNSERKGKSTTVQFLVK